MRLSGFAETSEDVEGTFDPTARALHAPRSEGAEGQVVEIIESAAPGIYLGWGAFVVQLGNLIVIAIMLALFVLALIVPFPKARRRK